MLKEDFVALVKIVGSAVAIVLFFGLLLTGCGLAVGGCIRAFTWAAGF